jgi:hypothetical protein
MTRRTIDPAIGRRGFCLSLGAGMTILAIPGAAAGLKKVPMSTGIDAVFVPFVVAADRQIFEKYGLEPSYKPFDDGNVALDAVLTGTSDIGSTSELGGLARWDRGGKLYVASILITSKEQIGVTAREEIKKPQDLVGKTVGYPRASAGHYYFGRYVKKYGLPADQIKVKFLQAPEMVAALERRDIDAFFLWEPWHTKAVALGHGGPRSRPLGRRQCLHPVRVQLLLGGAGERTGTGRGSDQSADRSHRLLRHPPGRRRNSRRQGVPHPRGGHEALHEPDQLPDGDAHPRGGHQFQGSGGICPRAVDHQEDARLERLHSAAIHEGSGAGSNDLRRVDACRPRSGRRRVSRGA